MQVLVVEAHEGERDALEFAWGDVRLGRLEAELADLLPVGIRGRTHADAGNCRICVRSLVLGQRAQGQPAQRARRRTAPMPAAPWRKRRRVGLLMSQS